MLNCRKRYCYLLILLFKSATAYASYIETTIGTAVVNDATAAYYNPAALTLLKNPQLIPLINDAQFRTEFSGKSTAVATHLTESGTSTSVTNFYSPTFYTGMPINEKMTIGFAVVSNFANRNPEEHSILRYTQASNNIQDYDLVPAIGIKINEYFALGANINFSQLDLHLHPLIGFPGSNIADSQSQNKSNGNGIGMSIGGLLSISSATLIGLNYRSVTKYSESGSSEVNGLIHVMSNNYHFNLRTPARTTLTISQSLTSALRLLTTIHRVQWSIIRNINVYNIATIAGITPTIVKNASIPQYLRDTWTFTLGAQYRFSPEWIIRAAGTFNQSPYSGQYQVSNGDSYVLGASVGYDINKIIKIDASYAYVFMQNQAINIDGNRFLINGTNKGSRDAVSLKLTVNIV